MLVITHQKRGLRYVQCRTVLSAVLNLRVSSRGFLSLSNLVLSLRSEFTVEGIVLSHGRLKNLDVSEKLAGF